MTRHDKRDLERAKLLAEIFIEYWSGSTNPQYVFTPLPQHYSSQNTRR